MGASESIEMPPPDAAKTPAVSPILDAGEGTTFSWLMGSSPETTPETGGDDKSQECHDDGRDQPVDRPTVPGHCKAGSASNLSIFEIFSGTISRWTRRSGHTKSHKRWNALRRTRGIKALHPADQVATRTPRRSVSSDPHAQARGTAWPWLVGSGPMAGPKGEPKTPTADSRDDRYCRYLVRLDRVLSDWKAGMAPLDALVQADHIIEGIAGVGSVDAQCVRCVLARRGIDDERREDMEKHYLELKRLCGQRAPSLEDDSTVRQVKVCC